jgi:hypothetical protein
MSQPKGLDGCDGDAAVVQDVRSSDNVDPSKFLPGDAGIITSPCGYEWAIHD